MGVCLKSRNLLEQRCMATQINPTLEPASAEKIPHLHAGERLTRTEFEHRYAAMPHVNKAELVEGVVYMPSPVSADEHGEPHFDLITWLGIYRIQTPGVLGGDNTTLRLDADNEPQTDAHLRIRPESGGSAQIVDGFIQGAPEFVAEVSATSASYELHDKLNAYRRNGVKEYLVWRVEDAAIDWFVLQEGDSIGSRWILTGSIAAVLFPVCGSIRRPWSPETSVVFSRCFNLA